MAYTDMPLCLEFERIRVLIRGGGDLGSGVAYRLKKAGFPVVMTELQNPLFVRRGACYGSAVFQRTVEIDGVTATLADDQEGIEDILPTGIIPVVIDRDGAVISSYKPEIIVDARMLKRKPERVPYEPRMYIGLGPGFLAPEDCDAIIETKRGHWLGRVIWQGEAIPDTGDPGSIGGITSRRVVRSPAVGPVRSVLAIGDEVTEGSVIAFVGEMPVNAGLTGILRGMIFGGTIVTPGMKIGDIDPGTDRSVCFSISDKALAIGGGVIEAILTSSSLKHGIHAD